MRYYEKTTTRIDLGRWGGAFVVDLPIGRVDAEVEYVVSLYTLGLRVEAIKHIRAVFDCSLREAKLFCEQAFTDAGGAL